MIKFTKNDDSEIKIKIGVQEIKNANKFSYLSVLINNDGKDQKEIKMLTGMVKMLGNQKLNLSLWKETMR